ncbi:MULTISPECIES: TlpA disulfide reductase family protein [Actinomycetes]|uniref:Thiol-disulfide isomerase/thioredoxin n=2 Tax=Williamsia marianensis TaxID=85044 RepID=A0A495JYS6_WILMA|nr:MULTISPECIES: TlpA disulfide reductase family protein [Actinomycetes]RKR94147.1 thiol-disulfide isomerase/thioredoxin [Williamsia muralis]
MTANDNGGRLGRGRSVARVLAPLGWRLGLLAVLGLVTLLVMTACSTGDDAVAQGDTFEFVSPGGKTVIFYDPPADRGKVAAISGEDLLDDTKTINLSDFAGQVVVINVWGSWCGPCRGEAAALEQVYEATKAQGVSFLGIDLRDEKSTARDFVKDRGVTYPSIFDFPGRTLAKLTTPTSVVPTTLVLDRDHRAAAVFLKAITAEELQPVVERVAAESAPQQ